MCVCSLDIYTDTNVIPVNRWSCDSCSSIGKRRVHGRVIHVFSIGKRRVHTSSAESVCVECRCISNTVWWPWSSNITRTKWKIFKFNADFIWFWPIKVVVFAVFGSVIDILVNISVVRNATVCRWILLTFRGVVLILRLVF